MMIINSRLDTDLYKLTMWKYVKEYAPDINVTYQFICRNKDAQLTRYIKESELRDELSHVRTLFFTGDELRYLSNLYIGTQPVFSWFEANLMNACEPPAYELRFTDDSIYLIFSGKWRDAIWWETHPAVMRSWQKLYPYEMRIDLPDTFGSEYAIEQMTRETFDQWRGFRQDSGDPSGFAQILHDRCVELGVDMKEKTLIFSDGLDVQTIVALAEVWDHFDISFGWGTNLTCDLLVPPISIVIKLVKSCGQGVVKLSDTPAKAQGPPTLVGYMKKLFEYTEQKYIPTRY